MMTFSECTHRFSYVAGKERSDWLAQNEKRFWLAERRTSRMRNKVSVAISAQNVILKVTIFIK